METKLSHGLPPPASLREIIRRLFNNVIASAKCTGNSVIAAFAKLELTEEQKARIVIPEGMSFTGLFLLFQFDTVVDEVVQSSTSQIVAFLTKDSDPLGENCKPYIYGYYLHIIGQPRFSLDEISQSYEPLQLASTVTFVPRLYIEIYNNVEGTPTVQGLDTDGTPTSTLQYSVGKIYYYQTLSLMGITNAADPPFKIIGLSNNLKKIK